MATRGTGGALRRPSTRQIVVGGVVLVLVVLIGAGIVWLAGGIAAARGGGIEKTATRTGVAEQVQCSPNLTSLGADWICTATTIAWSGGALPAGVAGQQPPYRILAAGRLAGRVTVTSHLPMGWQTAGSGRRSGVPTEIIVADGHPVGSTGWWAVAAWAPLGVAGIAAVVLALVLRRRWVRRARRRLPRSRSD